MNDSDKIELLYFQGCPGHELAKSLLLRLMRELDVMGGLIEIEIADEKAAVEHEFPGSPTVRVNGRDIEDGNGTVQEYGFKCRVYYENGKANSCPSEVLLRDALLKISK